MRLEENQNLCDDIKAWDYHNDNRVDKSNADSSSAIGSNSFGGNLPSAPITPNATSRGKGPQRTRKITSGTSNPVYQVSN